MNKFDEKLAQYVEDAKKIGIAIDENLLKLVTKGLGPSIYSKDASTVAGTDQSELDRLKNNFLIKKLGLKDGPELNDAIHEVLKIMGTSNKNKHRALVYYLLTIKFNKQSLYK
ncbi:MAG: DUF2853 family protein [Saprospiraceae bacterium]|uniref:DUF2853 family protein n=1 Tax=Candidatus Defluviibacterium haderslevense TaxID=2981993 RepID=A0A9D7XG84_9BACT|nr:DUF2853 family protein [Candidatus Defluviibacterium haderslevense]MBK9716458.1 DUF2853 family protein [Candidatus Defluviibacterium haderslevense]MBL0238803.1 DUF2853 family protein [Candidatus Defluviibacterium haderslevense]